MSKPATPQILLSEHATLSAVLRNMLTLVQDARLPPDFPALRAMLFYVHEFPEQVHHVKESRMLFRRLRERTDEADAVLERLDREHHGGVTRLRELQHQLNAWEVLGTAHRDAFAAALARYADFYLEHMRTEEEQVLPIAMRSLSAEDWAIVDRAFGAHRDPLSAARPEAPYAELFHRIVRPARPG